MSKRGLTSERGLACALISGGLRPILYDQVCVFEEAAILESHGIEVQSPGGLSNSDEVDAGDFPDQVTCHGSVSPWQRKPGI